jgi:AAA domain
VGDKQRPPEIPADLELIESVIKEHKAKLVIIEPLAAFLAGPDANKDQEIRRVLYKLSKIAERNNCTIIVLRHLNKSGGGKAIYRGDIWPARICDARTAPPPPGSGTVDLVAVWRG